MYCRLLDALRAFVAERKPYVLLHFELVPINVFQKYNPDSMLSGCCFHLTHNFVRRLGELRLKKLVSESNEVRK